MGGCHFGLATNNSLTLGSIESWEAKQNRGRTTKWKPTGSCLFLLCNLKKFFREKYGYASRHGACIYIQHCFSTWLLTSCTAFMLWFGNHKIWVQANDKYRNHYSQLRVVANGSHVAVKVHWCVRARCTQLWHMVIHGLHARQALGSLKKPSWSQLICSVLSLKIMKWI